MLDKLLSQSEVDALVSSLNNNREVKIMSPASLPMKGMNPSSNVNPPAKLVVPTSAKTTATAQASATTRPALPARSELKFAPGAEKISAIEAKVTDLFKRLDQLTLLVNRMEVLEKRIVVLEAGLAKEKENTVVNRQIQTLAEELKRISVNLQNTPGYGIRRQFKCEKCDDQGSVATMFRCTHCGHESWRGWWPQK